MGGVMSTCCSDSKTRKEIPDTNPETISPRDGDIWIFKNSDGDISVKQDIGQEYHIGYQLGQPGQFGVAYNCTRKSDNAVFAVKRIEKRRFLDPKDGVSPQAAATYCQQFRDEIKIMQSIDHPNIIKLVDVFEDPESLNLVMEKCDGGELFDRIKKKKTIQ